MRNLTLLLILITTVLVTGEVLGNEFELPQPLPVDPVLSRLPISSMLYHLEEKVVGKTHTGENFQKYVQALGFQGNDEGMVNVEILNRNGDIPLEESLIRSHGGLIDAVWRGQTSCWILPSQAVPLAEALPAGYFLRHANLATDNDEGPATVGSASYINPGPAGQGMIVGIMDRNYFRLTEAQDAGVAPADAIRHNYNTNEFESGTTVHGTGHTETVFDHAPDAEFHLFRIGNSTHLGLAVDDAIDLGVNVMSATQSFYNEGWEDNSGAAAQAVNHAASNGMLYVSSSGNRGLSHWQGSFIDADGNGWMTWNGADETNDLGARQDSSYVTLYLQWDRSGGGPDYNLYLYDQDGTPLQSSTSGGDAFEQIVYQNVSGSTMNFTMAVRLASGSPVDLEVFEISGVPIQYHVPESSLTSPNNSSAANCLVIGAVPFSSYIDNSLAGYSSRGPTNSGGRGIDLVGPTNTTTLVYGFQGYSGTSCSTPNTAGAIAALWASNPDLNAEGIRYLVTHLAGLYNDWGAVGPDPQYGYGGVQLPAYRDLTFWVDRSVGNITNLPGYPWYYVDDAIAGSVNNARLLFLGGAYPQAITLEDPRILQSVGESAVLGDNQ